MKSPLDPPAPVHVGPTPITSAVVDDLGDHGGVDLGGIPAAPPPRARPVFDASRRPSWWSKPSTCQIRDTMRVDPAPYRAFIGTLFVFIFVANWSSLVPGVTPPTAQLETDAALALIVFVAVIWFGVRAGGLSGYLATFALPNPLMIPLNFVESLTRTFSLLIRLFGNVMSGVFVIGIILSLAGLRRADPADGARSADRRGAGLHLRRAGDGVHRRRGRAKPHPNRNPNERTPP